MRVDGYDNLELIHQSDRSRVYRAVRLVDGRQAVLKTPAAPNAGRIRSLRREFRLLRGLDIIGIPRAFELIETDCSIFLAMSRFVGQPLSRLIAAGPMDLNDFFTMALDAVAVLGRIHDRNLAHCRLNDGAVLFDPQTGRAALVELAGAREAIGLARPLITPRRVDGPPVYISPEQTGQTNRNLDHRTDFYSLGAVFYQALTGRPPFLSEDPDELIRAHLTADPEPPDRLNLDLPPALSALILKLLTKDPADRYLSAEGLIDDLKICQGQLHGRKTVQSFNPGRTDRTDRLLICEKLYNRKTELDRLREAFDQAAQGRGRTVFISGGSGVGKTSLVRELQSRLAGRGGYFIRGRIDHRRNHIPYSGLVAACADLSRQILKRPAADAAAWKARIRKAIGPNGHLLTGSVPELRLLLGPQPVTDDIPAAEARGRFDYLITNLTISCAAPDRPLVIFLDNLQRIDSSSVNLLEMLIGSIGRSAVLLIGAYRDNHTPPDHFLSRLLDRLRPTTPGLLELKLTELSQEHLVELLSETLSLPWGELVELNDWLFQQTGGNPLLFKTLLAGLHGDGLLTYDPYRERWIWDIQAIRAIPRVDNAAELIRRQINHLAGSGVDLLGPAALMGNRFDLDLLAAVVGRSRRQTDRLIQPSLTNGLIHPLDSEYESAVEDRAIGRTGLRLAFSHDLVRRAAYTLIPAQNRPAIHGRIGRLLFNRLKEEGSENLIYEAAGQLNQGPAPAEKKYRIGLARLNLAAGEEAKSTAAFGDAIHYFEAAARVLGPDSWSEHPALALEVHLGLAEAGGLVSDFDRAEELFTQIRRRAATTEDLLALLTIQTEQYRRQDRRREAIDLSCEALAMLGLEIPRKDEDLIGLIRDEEVKITALLDGADPETVFELHETEDPETIRLHQFLFGLHRDAKRSDRPILAAYAAATSARLTLGRGLCSISAIGLVNHAVRLCADGRYKTGGAFGRAALRLAERSPNASLKSYTYHSYALGVNHWFRSLATGCDYLRKAAEAALESGSPETGWVFVHLAGSLFISGAPLKLVEKQFAESIRHLTLTRSDDLVLVLQLLVGRPLGLLSGRIKPGPPEGGVDPAQILKKAKDAAFFSAGSCYGRMRGMLLDGMYQPLSAIREWTTRCEQAFSGEFLQADCALYGVLHLTRGYDRAPDRDKPDHLRFIRETQARFTAWAKLVPENFLHKLLIIEAESSRLAGDYDKAMDLFNRAVEAARDHKFLNDAALASELAWLMRLDQGRPDLAQDCLEQAAAAYNLWGAPGRVGWLKARQSDPGRPPRKGESPSAATGLGPARRPTQSPPRSY